MIGFQYTRKELQVTFIKLKIGVPELAGVTVRTDELGEAAHDKLKALTLK